MYKKKTQGRKTVTHTHIRKQQQQQNRQKVLMYLFVESHIKSEERKEIIE